MTVHKRSEKAAVNKSRNRDVFGRRREMSDDLITFDEAFQLMAFSIVPAAAVAMREVVRIQILNCWVHVVTVIFT